MFIHDEHEADSWDRAVVCVIAATRIELRLTHRQLGERLHVSSRAICALEGGRKRVYASYLPIIAEALELPTDVMIKRILLWRSTTSPNPQNEDQHEAQETQEAKPIKQRHWLTSRL